MSRSPEERVLVLASPREHPELFAALGQAAAYWIECADLPHLYQELEEGAAALLLADGWRSPDLARLSALLARQETWSELPVLLFAHPSEHLEADAALQLLGNVTLLEWPVRTATLVTTIQSALRSRSRQYQIRERLREGADAERKLRQGEERLRFSLEAGHLGFWQHNQLTDELICSDLLKSHFGRAPQDPLRHSEIVASVHPDDLDRVQRTIRQAIRARESYVIEYRVVWPDRSVHWVMVRGRASYDAAGQSVSTFGVTLDISQRKTAEAYQAEQSEQLRRLSEGLREAARRKDEFLAMLAHELRNPLAPVAHAVEIIRTRPGQVQAERAREVVERQLRHMNRLIEDLLDVSRINSGKITLKQERLDLVRGILAAIESQHAFIAASGHTLETVLPAEPVYADVDPVRLEQVVVNLLNNAAKYTEPGGHIRISLETTENAEAQIRVADNGIGIPSPLLAQVFDLFTQGERGLDRSRPRPRPHARPEPGPAPRRQRRSPQRRPRTRQRVRGALPPGHRRAASNGSRSHRPCPGRSAPGHPIPEPCPPAPARGGRQPRLRRDAGGARRDLGLRGGHSLRRPRRAPAGQRLSGSYIPRTSSRPRPDLPGERHRDCRVTCMECGASKLRSGTRRERRYTAHVCSAGSRDLPSGGRLAAGQPAR
ncbi:MAG: luxQ 9 [Armatimonadetes bacterium]|nr:luxQ 9 [Armatimonadota bacterium]